MNCPPWRLNSLRLSDPSFWELISSSIDTFLRINKTPDTSYSLLWDTLKAYLGGYIISYASHQNKIRKAKETDSNAILDIDRVEWEYLLTVLKKYTSPSVNTNNIKSEYFNLFRGTCQGYSLSPLVFAIAIEPLSIGVRNSTSFLGITRRGVEHRLALYADDLLLYITDPLSQLPNILSLLQNFI